MTRVSDVVSQLLGTRLVADTGEWGTYAWTEHVLGLPGEPRVDREVPFRDMPR